MLQQISIALLLICLTISGAFAQADSYVFMVRTSNTIKRLNRPIVQTGFRMRGKKGIVTALHGVAVGKTWTAISASKTYASLRIKAVDVEHDVALLTSDELERGATDGLTPANARTIRSSSHIKVLGHPRAISLNERDARVGTPALQPLHEKLPPDSAFSFEQRNSPSTDITIIYIEGNLVPGESGAPALNARNEVVGIVNGGIDKGAAGIAWGIPVSDIKWQSYSSQDAQNKVLRLASPLTLELFSVTIDEDVIEGARRYYDYIMRAQAPVVSVYEAIFVIDHDFIKEQLKLFPARGHLTPVRTPIRQAPPPPADVPSDHPASNAVAQAIRLGVIIPYADGTIGGRRVASREWLAVYLARLTSILNVDNTPSRGQGKPAVDVSDDSEYSFAIQTVTQWGLMRTDAQRRFHPESPVSFDDLLLAVNRLRSFWNLSPIQFQDPVSGAGGASL